VASRHVRDLGAISTLIRVEIAPRSRTSLDATYGHRSLHRRAHRTLKISVAPGGVLIRPWGPERRPAAGGISPRGGRGASPEEAESGAYAPPQGRPTRPPPIIRGTSRPLPTNHTLARVVGPTGPRRWPTLHTAETAALTTHVVTVRPLILQCTPLPPASVHYSCQAAPKRLAARQG